MKYTSLYTLIIRKFSAHESLLGRELEAHIVHSIKKLPAECRKIFELSRSEGLKYKEIAETLNISVKTVEAQMSKALRSLRVELTDYITLIAYCLISHLSSSQNYPNFSPYYFNFTINFNLIFCCFPVA